MIKEKLIEEIKSFIFSRDDIEYKTVRWDGVRMLIE